jgi:hypothetical protein
MPIQRVIWNVCFAPTTTATRNVLVKSTLDTKDVLETRIGTRIRIRRLLNKPGMCRVQHPTRQDGRQQRDVSSRLLQKVFRVLVEAKSPATLFYHYEASNRRLIDLLLLCGPPIGADTFLIPIHHTCTGHDVEHLINNERTIPAKWHQFRRRSY